MRPLFEQIKGAVRDFAGTYLGQRRALTAFQAYIQISTSLIESEGTNFSADADELSVEIETLSKHLEVEAWTMKRALEVMLPKQAVIVSPQFFSGISWDEIGEFSELVNDAINRQYELKALLQNTKSQLERIAVTFAPLQASATGLSWRIGWHLEQFEAFNAICNGSRTIMDKEF